MGEGSGSFKFPNYDSKSVQYKSVFIQFLTNNKLPDKILLIDFGIEKSSSIKFLANKLAI